jgi:prepilin-type N-terminal cleavage/methylation domain-containing protein
MHLLPLNTKAFTLVELIVVMALIAVTASFAVPQIANFLFTDQLKVSVRKLVGLIHRTSQLAQQQQVPYLLTYQQRERVFTVRPERVEENTACREKRESAAT